MHKIVVTIENPDDASLFVKMVERLTFVESVRMEGESKEYDWINPSRPATDEEAEQMIAESEAEYDAGLFISGDEARKKTLEELAKWKKEQKK